MNFTKKSLSILNLTVLLFVFWWNYYSNTGNINGNTIGSISKEVTNLFTPASYAFSIWGLIYLLLLSNAIFLVSRAFSKSKKSDFVTKAATFLILANLFNSLWIWLWLNEMLFYSVICMLGILSCLTIATIKLKLEKYDAPLFELFFLFWPLTVYIGWISVATIANITSWLTAISWQAPFGELFWGIALQVIASALALFMLYKRNMREFVAVVIWALIAIAFKNWGIYPTVAFSAIGLCILLAIENTRHAIKNWDTLPINKIKKGEW